MRTLTEELHAWQLVLPRTAAFPHLTAAELRGWWLPAPIIHPVFAAVTTTSHGVERAGLLMCRFGRFVARADLLIDGTPRLPEYDGAVHRDADVHETDLARDRALLSAKFERYGFT